MTTRNPPAVEVGPVPDEPRVHDGAREPFALQLRSLGEGEVKIIWWYVAAVNEEEEVSADTQEVDTFGVKFYSYNDVLEKLTFEMDRDVVSKAINIVESHYSADRPA